MWVYLLLLVGFLCGDDHLKHGEADQNGVDHDFIEDFDTLLQCKLVVEWFGSVVTGHLQKSAIDVHFDSVVDVA